MRTKTLGSILLLVLCLLISSWARAADKFIFGFEDLPLMPGLEQVSDNSFMFETPYGRIVEASVTGKVAKKSVIAFYRNTLPQLGWLKVAEFIYQREGEKLVIEFLEPNSNLNINFFIEPFSR